MEMDLTAKLSYEVIEFILEDKNITFQDIIRFSSTCKRLYTIVRNNNKLWKIKFFQRWPYLKEAYEEINCNGNIRDWLNEIQNSLKIRRKLSHQLLQMSNKNYKKQELSESDLEDFYPFAFEEGVHSILTYHFFVDEIMELLKHPIIESNLTYRYYALKIIRYLKQKYVANEWHKFINLPPEKQILERGAVLVSQWSQPDEHISYSYVSSMIDDIANEVKRVLNEEHPMHPIFLVPEEQLINWKCTNISDNQWSTVETKQIMDLLCDVLFHKLGFHGNSVMYYSMENSFIDKVIKHRHGIPITLSILFESVARRLGIRCEPVSFPSHFLLRWKENYSSVNSKDMENFYIDVFNGGKFLTVKSCPKISGITRCPIDKYNVHTPSTATQVIARMANILEVAARQHTDKTNRIARLRSALELQHMVQPLDTNISLQLGRFYIRHQMSVEESFKMLINVPNGLKMLEQKQTVRILQMLQVAKMESLYNEDVQPKKRIPVIKYATGLIMKCGTDLCVIVGWKLPWGASDCEMHDCNNIKVAESTLIEPIYNVLLNSGAYRYVNQGEITLTLEPKWINHCEVGRYFCKFNGTHYTPNEEMAREYPEDDAVRETLISKYFPK